jgi:UDP-glucuronate 4-epimerase
MKALVTGIAGFIGSQLAERLVARGDEVVGLDNFDPFYDRAIKERNLSALLDHIEFREGDIRDRALLDELLSRTKPDVVVHLAALAGVRPSIAAPARYQEVNVVGTANLADAMVHHGLDRLVFASSSSVYGDNTDVPFVESNRVDLPASPYAASKRSCELLLRSIHRVHGLSVTALRYFTVYGPRQRPEMAIHKFCRLIEDHKRITMFGDGQTSRDYTYVDDIVDGTLGAMDRAPRGFSIYNLGNTHPVSLTELIASINAATGKEAMVDEAPLAPGDVMHTWASVEAARRDFGYEPNVSLGEGLRRFVSWMRDQPR